MELDKFKKLLLDLVKNFLIDDYSSWQLLGMSKFMLQKSSDWMKKMKNSQQEKS